MAKKNDTTGKVKDNAKAKTKAKAKTVSRTPADGYDRWDDAGYGIRPLPDTKK